MPLPRLEGLGCDGSWPLCSTACGLPSTMLLRAVSHGPVVGVIN